MLLRLALLFAFLVAPSTARAAEFSLASKIEAVTVFPAGAEISRTVSIDLAPGAHTLILKDLPGGIAANSIRVEGETASGTLELGSVDAREITVGKEGPPGGMDDTERKRIEREVQDLRDQRSVQESAIEAANVQKALAQNLAQLPLGGPAKTAQSTQGEARPQPDWSGLFDLIGARLGQIHAAIHAAQVRQRALDEKIRELEDRLNREPPVETERTELRIYVDAASQAKGILRIRYQAAEARWAPIYDARLLTGGKDREPSLTLTRRADISQETGEDWDDVTLTLSTTRPGGRTAAPKPRPVQVDFKPLPAPKPGVAYAPAPAMAPAQPEAYDMAGEGAAPESRALGGAGRKKAKTAAPVKERRAEVETSSFQAVFRIAGRVTVKSGVGAKKVQITTEAPKPALKVIAAPKETVTAFLHARFTHQSEAPLLPGEVSLYRDGVFTGRGSLPLIAGGEEHEMGFGVDDAVRISRINVKRAKGESGILTSSNTDEQHFRIKVKSLHARPMPLIIIDQLPYSEDEKIKVELLPMTTQPAETNYDDKRGLLAWEFELKPGQEKDIALSYQITWPAKREVIIIPR